MKWKGRRQSSNVEDRRGSGKGKFALGGIGGIIILVIYLFTNQDPTALMEQMQDVNVGAQNQTELNDEASQFVKTVLADCEDVWTHIFEQNGLEYQYPTLVLFTGSVQSACGGASSAMGPFYCPADQKMYIDLSFYDELKNKFNAPGDFAMAYVIAHENAHHIQNLLGTSRKVQSQRSQLSKTEYNKLSVKLELQADFYAGVWAHYADRMKGVLETGDLEEALNAANAIGDDKLQKQAQGYVVPDAFTHGTSKQRMYWFRKGYETGDIHQGNTFELIRD
ncbi:metalloprotease [bacterium]|nr:metalloprotease [bacterium]